MERQVFEQQVSGAENVSPPGAGSHAASAAGRNAPAVTALLMAGSALLGGIAVALWNRRTLADMRDRREAEPLSAADEEIY